MAEPDGSPVSERRFSLTRVSWGGREVSALLLLGLVFVSLSGLLQLTSVTRLAAEDAATQCGLVTQALIKGINYRLSLGQEDPLAGLADDPMLGQALSVAASHAPSIAWVAICDSTGIALVHTNPTQIGTLLGYSPALPQPKSFAEGLNVLFSLRRPPFTYAYDRVLKVEDRPFLSIRIGVGDALLRARVSEAFRRGLVVAVVQLALAIGLGLLLSRFVQGRVRMLEAGVQAIREGRFDARIPETGGDEFRRLARDLNLLSAQFARERAGHGEASEHAGGDGGGPARQGQAAAELLGDAILAIGPDHRIVLANEEAGRLLGLPAKQLTQKKLEEAFPSDHPVRQLVTQLHAGRERSLVAPLQSAGRVAVAHRVPGGGSLVELKWAWQQEELHALVDHSRVVSRLAQMSAGVAHEIGNPLENISLQLHTLRDAHELSDEEVQSHVTVAAQNVQKVQRAITGFLTVARLRRPDPSEIRLDSLLEDALQSRQAEADLAGIELVLEVGRDPSGREIVFEADRQVLLQAIDNLIKNAIQAGPSREGKVWLRGGIDGAEVRIEVEDSGPGIPLENREQVFQLYFTTKRGGTGVGLALVRQAVELHAGTVTLDSEMGRGTRFILSLPLSARAH